MESLEVLVAIADTGSIRGAADALSLSRATVRRRVGALEGRAGGPVFVRDGHTVVLTPRGEVLVEQGRRLLGEVDAVFRTARRTGETLGTLTLALPPGLPPSSQAAGYALLRQILPRVRLVWRVVDDPVALLPDRADVALHIGFKMPEGPNRARVVTRVRERLMAHRDYLATAGRPTSLEALADHPLLLSGWEDSLPLLDGGTLPVQPLLRSTDGELIRTLAAQGHGIALVPDHDAAPANEALEPLLTDVVGRVRRVWVVLPEALSGNTALAALGDALGSLSA